AVSIIARSSSVADTGRPDRTVDRGPGVGDAATLAALRSARPLLALVLAGVAFALPARASAAARLGPCSGTGTVGLQCTEVDVPLDRTGAVPGTIPLHVEV